ncbi:double-stranded RNA-binding protein 1-like [Argentina anserina]|uniref:double-stranded RNA-binding protein 1-like n=1 Tax=Argentina anserina TaxID=57926 RepID=UPI002176414F|nr:double-stranded RNA-binding protein 1-like [Potentilla anserina]
MMYKSKLQELCHEKKWGLPRYTAIKDGPDHNPCFKACVSVNGFSFDSPVACKSSKQAQNQAAMVAFLHFTSPPSSPVDEHCTLESPKFIDSTLKEAENAALDAASMLISLPDLFQDEEPGRLYKNLLQELAQGEGFTMPIYTTVNSGASHMPTFSSTVDVEGEKFCGHVGKSKKQAELSAAKTAYTVLKERALKATRSANWRPTATGNKECAKDTKGIDEGQESNNISDNMNLGAVSCYAPDALVLEMDKLNQTGKVSSCSEPVLSSTEECPLSPAFTHDDDLSAVSTEDKNEGNMTGSKSYLLCNRFRVYTQFPDIAFPRCITVLPISDDKWVAVRLEFSNGN